MAIEREGPLRFAAANFHGMAQRTTGAQDRNAAFVHERSEQESVAPLLSSSKCPDT